MLTKSELRSNGSIAIVGAGPGGATLAHLLHKRGFKVRVFERDESLTARPQGGSLDVREDSGRRAIDDAGLGAAFERLSRPEASAFRMFDLNGVEMPGAGAGSHDGGGPEIDRGDLRGMLLGTLPEGMVAWDHRVESVEPEPADRWRLRFAGRDDVVADFVVGADGISSKVRSRLTDVEPVYIGITVIAADIRPALWRTSRISDVLGEGSAMFVGGHTTIFLQRCAHDLILVYYSLAVPLGWPRNAGIALTDTDAIMAAVHDAYSRWSPELVDMLTQVEPDFQLWPMSVMPPDHSWDTTPGLTMLGDASHVMPPFTGKGVNLALLDAFELAEALSDDLDGSVTDAVAGFERRMQARTSEEIRACLAVGKRAYGIDLGFDGQGHG